jgi:hypothetical protein
MITESLAMPAAKFVVYTLLVNFALTSYIQIPDLPPDDNNNTEQHSMRIEEPDVDPAVARARAIEMARSSTLCCPISSGFENGNAFDTLFAPPRRGESSLGRDRPR